jgi:hypothetical protein
MRRRRSGACAGVRLSRLRAGQACGLTPAAPETSARLPAMVWIQTAFSSASLAIGLDARMKELWPTSGIIPETASVKRR